MKQQPCKMNGIEYKNLKQACKSVGLSYDNAKKHKKKYGSKFEMKLVKHYVIEIKEKS
jgi:molybdenum-dependent DNA-binding transcriptional regulator ModE